MESGQANVDMKSFETSGKRGTIRNETAQYQANGPLPSFEKASNVRN